ncbi:MAG: phosphoribosylanthranilate isomerase [Thermodesulfobacteriota bacterium]|nr:phosphoribosylanthranilate isomerase [Thermodesulfobacteriota bacterium]
MWIKICGIRRYEDAYTAYMLGADAIGFILTPSKRMISADDLGKWIGQIQGVEKVGVFRDENPGYIARIAANLGLDTVQVHGPIGPGYLELKDKFQIILPFKDVGCIDHGLVKIFNARILVDASQGHGIQGQWEKHAFPFILAGGLNPENIRRAVKTAQPMGVDVSSGVELPDGTKDTSRMERFIREARS